jgi:hypothetical protein
MTPMPIQWKSTTKLVCLGSHNDIIQNQRNYLNNYKREMFGPCGCDDDTCEACVKYNYIDNEINDLEDWHIENGSINDII